MGERTGQVEDFLDACPQTRSSLTDRLPGEVLCHIKGSDEARQSYLLEALDAKRALHPNMSAFRISRGMFTLKVQVDDTQYEVPPEGKQ